MSRTNLRVKKRSGVKADSEFKYDLVLGEDDSQEEVFHKTGAMDMIERVVQVSPA